MTHADLLAVVLGLSLTTYALLGGADFGAGVLDLLARGSERERAALATGIGPLWEANHVWLIFSITILFSAFPAAFSALGTASLAPFTIALLAIVLRGAALGLRSSVTVRTAAHARLSRLYGIASVVAPVAFGMVAGGLATASSCVSDVHGGRFSIPWAGPFAVVAGVMALLLCVQLAAGFMTIRLVRGGQARLAERFRRRGIHSAVALLVISLGGLAVASWKTPTLAHRLTTTALAIVIAGVVAMVWSIAAFSRRRYAIARAASLSAGAALVWGWFVSQAPHLVGAHLTIRAAAAPEPAMTALAISIAVVLSAVIPAFLLLFGMFAHAVPEVSE
jgi:cytochrome d ubiquinol oxidase subunit II